MTNIPNEMSNYREDCNQISKIAPIKSVTINFKTNRKYRDRIIEITIKLDQVALKVKKSLVDHGTIKQDK